MLIEFAGETLSGGDHLHRLLTEKRAGTDVAVKLIRRGSVVETSVRPEGD